MYTIAAPALFMKTFQRRIEDFACLYCQQVVRGDGYRNHCPNCLISKHVDIHPGDRAAQCGGTMNVTDVVLDHGEIVLTHTCQRCQHHKRNKLQKDDNMDMVIALMNQ